MGFLTPDNHFCFLVFIARNLFFEAEDLFYKSIYCIVDDLVPSLGRLNGRLFIATGASEVPHALANARVRGSGFFENNSTKIKLVEKRISQ